MCQNLFLHKENFYSKPLNVHSESLNGHPQPLNGRSKPLNGNFVVKWDFFPLLQFYNYPRAFFFFIMY